MKKIIVGLALFAIPFFSFASFDQNLSYGSKGSAVKELQDFLIDQGDFAGQSTGSFYSLTRKGVVNFQVANNIQPASGYFGNLTRGVANKILADELDQSNQQALQENGTTTPVTEPTLKDTVATQMQGLLAQIQALQAQLKSLNDQVTVGTTIQTQTQQGIQQIVQNTTPVTLAPVIHQNMQDLTYKVLSSPTDIDQSVSIQLDAKDENGKYIEHPIIAITSTFNGQPYESVSTGDANYPYAFNSNMETGEKGVQYNPYTKQKGTYVFTFTAYGIVKTVTVTY